jgi:hypothetical protein
LTYWHVCGFVAGIGAAIGTCIGAGQDAVSKVSYCLIEIVESMWVEIILGGNIFSCGWCAIYRVLVSEHSRILMIEREVDIVKVVRSMVAWRSSVEKCRIGRDRSCPLAIATRHTVLASEAFGSAPFAHRLLATALDLLLTACITAVANLCCAGTAVSLVGVANPFSGHDCSGSRSWRHWCVKDQI